MSPSARAILSGLVEARTGQRLLPGAAARAEAVLCRLMAQNQIADFDALAAQIAAREGGPLAREVVDAMLNNETFFFRDSDPFRQIEQFLADKLRDRREDRRIRIWSAGCSTGQELYSIAMIAADLVDYEEDGRLQLLGTDISYTAVEKAKAGLYSQFEIQRGLPVGKMLKWFEQEGDQWRARPELRTRVEFRRLNLLEPSPAGYFDLILCRNVLIYFEENNRRLILDRLQSALDPTGALILGAGETLIGMVNRLMPLPGYRNFYGRPARPARALLAC